MKLTIEIDNLNNRQACVEAVARLYEAFVEHQGGVVGAKYIMDQAMYHGDSSQAISRRNFENACQQLSVDDLRLVLEYYAMSKPSKRGLAVELAKRNETLSKAECFYRGTRNPDTTLTQIKRVFTKYKIECAEIGKGSPTLRHERLQRTEEYCALDHDPEFGKIFHKLMNRFPYTR